MISVIVPVYNASKYLERCVNSILVQSFRDIEIILVNDGSTDNSLDICYELSKRDFRIKVIDQNNSGVSATRNKGFSESIGEYIIYIDADDMLENDMLQILYNNINEYNADMAMCGVKIIDEQNNLIRYENNTNECVKLGQKEAIERFLLAQNFNIGVWTKLYRRKVVENIEFVENKRVNEDKYYIFQSLLNTDYIVYNDVPKYIYVQNQDSVTHQTFSERWFDTIFFAEKIYQDIQYNFPEFEKQARYNYIFTLYCLISLMNNCNSIEQYNIQYKRFVKSIKEFKIIDIKEFFSPKIYYSILILRLNERLYRIMKRV